MRRSPFLLYLLAAASVAACGDEGTGPIGIAAQMLIVSGDGQQAVVGTELPDPLVVKVLDSADVPVAGQIVNFRVLSGNGAVFAGVGITNSDGLVQDRWTLGTSTADSQRVEARAVDPATGARLTFAVFRATALSGPAAAVQRAAGDAQTGPIGETLAESLAARVVDQYGNPVPGAGVAWSDAVGGGALSPSSALTDAAGLATAAWTLGPRLDTTHVASAASSTLPPARFTATPAVPAGATLTSTAGDGQTGTVGQTLADTLVVTMRLADGRPIRGATVTWAPATGNGSIAAVGPVTDSLGRSKARWTIGVVAGAQAAQATAYSLPPVPFSATGTPGAPAAVMALNGGIAYGVPTETLPESLRARVTDQYGNAVSGVTVAWSVILGGGSVSPAASTTDGAGRAAASFTLGPTPEHNVARASVGSLAPADFPAQATVPLASISAGQSHTCALASGASGAAYCWGYNNLGQVGATTTETCDVAPCALFPTAVAGGLQFVELSSHAGNHTCALTADGTAYCWGWNASGELGDGTTTNRSAPTGVVGGRTFRTVAAGPRHTCAVAMNDTTYCWGENFSFALGRSETGERCGATATNPGAPCSTRPLAVIGDDSTVARPILVALSVGWQLTCGRTGTGDAYCWGNNGYGQVGGGASVPSNTPNPTLVTGGHTFAQVAAGDLHACGATTTGVGYCWGANRNGEQGIGSTDEQAHPDPVAVSGGLTFETIAAAGLGGGFTCGVTTADVGYCWGYNTYDQLGTGSTTNPITAPAPVAGALELQTIAAGSTHGCALTTLAGAYCWGNGGDGKLGHGGTTNSAVPERVKGP